jgi:hypothetical protein
LTKSSTEIRPFSEPNNKVDSTMKEIFSARIKSISAVGDLLVEFNNTLLDIPDSYFRN